MDYWTCQWIGLSLIDVHRHISKLHALTDRYANMSGKGSKPRPIRDWDQYARNWDGIKWGTMNERFAAAVKAKPVGKFNLYQPDTHDRKDT